MSDADLPLVSALTPVYNYGRYLARTLDSALEQDYPADRLEIVIVDDGSTDETPDVIAEYEAKHPGRIRALRQENQGFIAATKRGARRAASCGRSWTQMTSGRPRRPASRSRSCAGPTWVSSTQTPS